MDIKAQVETIVNKAKSDPEFAKKFLADPAKTLEGVTGIDLPDDQINQAVNIVKTQLGQQVANGIGDAVKDKISGLFGAK
ncbi:MAG: hypothetical protein II782_03745 [Oscillospiraceae bacterium]|nr:hypothetical protein [Oscillospiraceae bacterium]